MLARGEEGGKGPSFAAGRNVNQHISMEIRLAWIPRVWTRRTVNQQSIEISAHPCLLLCYSQYPGNGASLHIHQRMNKETEVRMHHDILFRRKEKKNEIRTFAAKRIKLEMMFK